MHTIVWYDPKSTQWIHPILKNNSESINWGHTILRHNSVDLLKLTLFYKSEYTLFWETVWNQFTDCRLI